EGVEDKDLFISVVTIAEIQAGIEITREQDAEKADQIEQWLDLVANAYNVLSMTAIIFCTWAKLMHRKSENLYEDAMIAATAKIHDLIVVTRTVDDFRDFGLQLFNPFDGQFYES
ncbi:MAG: type II toxin-antitoxin system VapC family toxin, partial [Prochlorothrix sp.]|nr:type II toxin-antitoxin system VapC family toxin [Prochlorothrix sp.]